MELYSVPAEITKKHRGGDETLEPRGSKNNVVLAFVGYMSTRDVCRGGVKTDHLASYLLRSPYWSYNEYRDAYQRAMEILSKLRRRGLIQGERRSGSRKYMSRPTMHGYKKLKYLQKEGLLPDEFLDVEFYNPETEESLLSDL